jgi:anti-sigma regulatory factor (Ser/Thr protein kinase)
MVLTANTATLRVRVDDESYIGAARRAVRDRAAEIGLSGAALDKLDILSTELATNLSKYGKTGQEILVQNASSDDERAVTLICVDRGPGIADVDKALIDGLSTSNTLGAGLGSLKRLSNKFEISSEVGKGTIVICTVGDTSSSGFSDVAWLSVPYPGEPRCGDGVSICSSEHCTSILVVDGLGHGDGAADVSRDACGTFEQSPFEPGTKVIERLGAALSGTRGAAVAVSRIEYRSNKLVFVGVGNISSHIYSFYESTGCVSTQGVVGGQLRTLLENTYEWVPGSILLMHSDGIRSSASLASARTGKSAMMLAAEIYRDHYRANDDATVVVVKDQRRR